VHVRVPIVSVRIIIEVGRNAVVAARKSKAESFSSGNQYGRRILSIRTLGWGQSQSAYRKCGQEKSSHKFCLSLVSLFFEGWNSRSTFRRGLAFQPLPP
jgi:hypothetical protein